MAKKNEELFEESSQGGVSAVTAVFFILGIALGFGGILMAGYAFGPDVPSLELFSFGLLLSALGFALPFTILPLIGK